jgi:hypothetical protein
VKLYSYVVARDYGFAPNPFFGRCTLATCKPLIRRTAAVGDWVVGTGSKAYDLQGRLVFAMRVSEVLSYDEYWRDPRYRNKRPNLRGSLKQAYGDNIYHRRHSTSRWVQADSHHSNPDGTPNPNNIAHDCQAPRVLIGAEFVYWGRLGPRIPNQFRSEPHDVCAHRGHKCNFPQQLTVSFVEWIRSLGSYGYAGAPATWPK